MKIFLKIISYIATFVISISICFIWHYLFTKYIDDFWLTMILYVVTAGATGFLFGISWVKLSQYIERKF